MSLVTGESETLVPAEAFARTYSNPVYDDPWQAVEDYYDVQDVLHEHPNASSTVVANLFDLPRGRVKPWMADSKPDCVRGLESARQHGWIDVVPESRVFRGLNVFAGWVYSGGSISTQTFVPIWVIQDEDDIELLQWAARFANVIIDFTRKGGLQNRAQEMRPAKDASVLGRVLTVLGVPQGEKNRDTRIRLPDYLDMVPERVAREFLQVYIHNRGQVHADSDLIRFREERDQEYLRSVARLIRRLTGEDVSVSERNVIISANAAREIAVWDPLLGVE